MGEPAEKLNKGALQGFECPRRYPGYLPAVPSEPLSGSLLTPQSTSVGQTTAEVNAPFEVSEDADTPAPLPRLGGSAGDRSGSAGVGSWQARRGSPPPVMPLDVGTEPVSLGAGVSPRPQARPAMRERQAPRVPPVNLEAMRIGSEMTSTPASQGGSAKPSSRGWSHGPAALDEPLVLATGVEGRQFQASLPMPPTSVPTSRRGRSRPSSPQPSESGLEALPPVPTAMWFASKAEELERRRSRSVDRLEALGFASVWPPPPLPPLSEELRQRLERLEARRLLQQEDVSLARSLQESLDRCGELEAKLAASQDREEEALRKLQQNEADRARLEDRIASVQLQCDGLREELQNARARTSADRSLQRELQDLEAERDRLRSRYGESEKLRVDAAQARDSLREELRLLEDGLAKERQRAGKAERRAEELGLRLQEQETSEATLRQLERQLEESTTAKVALERRATELQRKLAEQSETLQRGQQEVQRSAQERQSLQQRILDMQGKTSLMESLQGELAELRSKNTQLEEDKRHLRKADSERKKAEESLRSELENLGRDKNALEQKLIDADRKLKVLQFDNEQLQAEATRSQEHRQRPKRERRVTMQAGQSDTSSRRHYTTVVEVDLLQEDGPRVEEKDVEDSDVSSTAQGA